MRLAESCGLQVLRAAASGQRIQNKQDLKLPWKTPGLFPLRSSQTLGIKTLPPPGVLAELCPFSSSFQRGSRRLPKHRAQRSCWEPCSAQLERALEHRPVKATPREPLQTGADQGRADSSRGATGHPAGATLPGAAPCATGPSSLHQRHCQGLEPSCLPSLHRVLLQP